MDTFEYTLIKKYRAWSHSDKEVLTTSDLDEVISTYVKSLEFFHRGFGFPSPEIKILKNDEYIGSYSEITTYNENIIKDKIQEIKKSGLT